LSKLKEVLELQVSGTSNLRLAAELLLDGFGIEAAAEPGQVAWQLIEGVERVQQEAQTARQEVETTRQAARDIVYTGVHHAFTVARSHYVNIDLEELSKGYSGDYADAELDAFEEETAPFARNLTYKMLEGNEDQ